MANLKKYEVTVEGLTVDFRKALSNTNDYNDHFCNSFTNLVYILSLPLGDDRRDILDSTRQELYARAYNYCRRAHGLDAHTACLLAEALCKKVEGYRMAPAA